MFRSSVSVALCFLLLGTLLCPEVRSIKFTDDTLGDECKKRAGSGGCISDSTTWFECPKSCSAIYRPKDQDDVTYDACPEPDYFYELTNNLRDGSELSFERFEGSVVLVVLLPMFEGMGQFYYDMLDHILSIFPRFLDIAIYPFRFNDDVDLKINPESRITVFEDVDDETYKEIEMLGYANFVTNTGHDAPDFFDTSKVTTILVGANAMYMEKRESPHMVELAKSIAKHIKFMDEDGEL